MDTYHTRTGRHFATLAAANQVDALLAALPPTPTPGWQDISTAPKDVPVLTFRGAGLMSVAERIDHPGDMGKKKPREIWCCTDGCELLNVTHWQPLPPAPTGGRE
jgi:hypothetical protein